MFFKKSKKVVELSEKEKALKSYMSAKSNLKCAWDNFNNAQSDFVDIAIEKLNVAEEELKSARAYLYQVCKQNP